VDRLVIIGCGGSGKSRLARALGTALGITPVHLDTLYYDTDWNPLPKEKFAALQHDLVTQPRWIIDGNYASSLPIRLRAADTVIFLDLPARSCLAGIARRRLRHGGGQHHATGVYDRITPGFVRYIIGYRRQMAPRVRRLIAEHAGEAGVIVLRSRRATRRYLAEHVHPLPSLPRVSTGAAIMTRRAPRRPGGKHLEQDATDREGHALRGRLAVRVVQDYLSAVQGSVGGRVFSNIREPSRSSSAPPAAGPAPLRGAHDHLGRLRAAELIAQRRPTVHRKGIRRDEHPTCQRVIPRRSGR
jgi:adenylate kinase family enzyme